MAVGTLTVNVAARTGKALQNLTKFRKGVSSTTSRIKKMGKGLATLKGGLGALAGVAGVGLGFRGLFKIVDDLDAVAKASARLGEDPGRMQALAHGANLAGVEVRQLNKALEAATRRISEAAQGEGQAVGALRDLGLEAERLNRMSPTNQLLEIADGMSKLDNQADRVRISMDLFSRSSGAAMVNFLQGGSAAINEATRRFDKFGRRFSKQELAKIENFKDAWTDIQLALSSTAQTIAVELVPAMQDLSKNMPKMGDKVKKWFDVLSAFAREINRPPEELLIGITRQRGGQGGPPPDIRTETSEFILWQRRQAQHLQSIDRKTSPQHMIPRG